MVLPAPARECVWKKWAWRRWGGVARLEAAVVIDCCFESVSSMWGSQIILLVGSVMIID